MKIARWSPNEELPIAGAATVPIEDASDWWNSIVAQRAGLLAPNYSLPAPWGYSNEVMPSFDPVLAANQTFVNINGGDTQWLGVVDFRKNVTDDGTGKAQQLDDVRGAGVGHLVPLVQATQSKRFAITANGLVGTAAAQSNMLSALDSRISFDGTGDLHFLLVARSPTGVMTLLSVSQNPLDVTSLPYVNMVTRADGNYGADCNVAAAGSADQFLLNDGTLFDATNARAMILGKCHSIGPGGSGTVIWEMQTDGRQSARVHQLPPAPNSPSGSMVSLGGLGADMTFMWMGITTQPMTWDLLSSFYAFAEAQFPQCKPDLSVPNTICFRDDSVQRGHTTTHPRGWTVNDDGSTSPPFTCQNITTSSLPFFDRGFDPRIQATNHSSNGRTLADETAEMLYQLATEFDSRRGGKVIVVTCPAYNSFHNTYTGSGDTATYITALKAYYTAIVAAGVKAGVVVEIVMSTVGDMLWWYTNAVAGTGAIIQVGTNVQTFNADVRANYLSYPGVVGYIEIEADPSGIYTINVGGAAGPHSCTNLTNYSHDGTSHRTDVGSAAIGVMQRGFFDLNPTIMGLGYLDDLANEIAPLLNLDNPRVTVYS